MEILTHLADGFLIGTGHSRIYPAASLSLGFHEFCFLGTDDDGEDGIPDCVWVEKVPVPSNLPPSVNITAQPCPASDSSQMRPPCRSTIRLARARPIPLPGSLWRT